MTMLNTPDVRLGIVAVSRDCFPLELSRKRLGAVVETAKKTGLTLIPAETIIESETDAVKALSELADKEVNAVVVYLGNFGPEGPTTIFIERFPGPAMCCAAAEESGENLISGRGDAFCGMLNLSYNLNLRAVPAHIPERPVGLPKDLVPEMARFKDVARVVLGVEELKVFGFGPRPHDFYACNAPIQPLYDLGIEVMENSELDLLQLYQAAADNSDVEAIAADMTEELGEGNTYPDLIKKLAQFESALIKFVDDNLGSRKRAVFANKCWPAFESAFGFVPCYVNGRMAAKGIPVACEVDIYGAVSEYMAQLASNEPVTILDVNNTVPADMTADAKGLEGFDASDLFMGFHCGNTASGCLKKGCSMKFQLIMRSLMEPDKEPDITRGTLEGTLKPGDMTMFRLQSTPDGEPRSYAAEGRILDMDPKSFGGIGVIAVKGMSRFYRHVLIGQHFPHHTAVAFKSVGGILFDAVKLLAGMVPATPLPDVSRYPLENPFGD